MTSKKTTRTIELTIERRDLFIRQSQKLTVAWCDGCRKRVPVLTVAEAVVASGSSVETIYRQVEAAEVHFTKTSERSPLVCLTSFAESLTTPSS